MKIKFSIIALLLISILQTNDCFAQHSNEISKKKENHRIAQQGFQFLGINFVNFSNDISDNPSGFVQTMGRLSVPLRRLNGIGENAKWSKRLIPVRNMMLQLGYTNMDVLPVYYDSIKTSPYVSKYVNNMDLLQYSKFQGSMFLNLLTIVLPESKHKGILGNIYFDAYTSLLSTKIKDTTVNEMFNINTAVYGLNAKFRSSGMLGTNKVGIEVGGRIFWMYNNSDRVIPNLNFQYKDRAAREDLQNQGKPITTSNDPLFNLDVLFFYKPNADEGTGLFIHYSYFANSKFATNTFNNTFMQLQVGASVDLKSFIPSSKKEKKEPEAEEEEE